MAQAAAPANGTDCLDSKLLLKTLIAVKNGDFSVRLPDEWTGIDGKVADTFNAVMMLNQRMAQELERVSQAVGKEGRVGTTIRTMVQYCFSYDPQQQTYVFNLLRVSATVILTTLGIFLAWLLMTGKKKRNPRTDLHER